MKCKMCDQYHTTKKISVGDYAERIVDHFNWLDENKELSYYGDMKLGNIIETPKFELDGFLDTLVEDLNRYNGRLKQELLNNVDWIGQKIVHGTRRKIETNDKMHRDILKYWLWKWIMHRGKYKKLKPSLWNYLKRCGKGFESCIAQGCVSEWWTWENMALK